MSESVLVVYREDYPEMEQGFELTNTIEGYFGDTTYIFRDRSKAEKEEVLKQVIPYVVLRCDGYVLRYRRTKKGGEKRLHNLFSIGVGGHINPCDMEVSNHTAKLTDIAMKAAERELNEELCINQMYTLDFVGVLNNEEDKVGRAHVGLVYECWLDDNTDIHPNEDTISQLGWVDVADLQHGVEYEAWSDILIKEWL